MEKKAVSHILSETCKVFVQVFQPLYISLTFNSKDRKEMSKGFDDLLQFAHVLRVFDGKNLQIEALVKAGTLYHRYKGFFNVVLLAICKAK